MTEAQIDDIAGWLECGMVCSFHRPTGKVEYHPDPNDPYFEPEDWQEILDKIENDRENYDQFEKMNSSEAYRVMEDFSNSLSDTRTGNILLKRLSRPKPFRNFNVFIHDSDFRQDWFDFKKQAYIDFVKEQIEASREMDQE